MNVVNRLLRGLTETGVISQINPPENTNEARELTPRELIIEAFVEEERTYVFQLELLQALKLSVERGSITGDAIHATFFSLDVLVDFQRRFLIRVEMMRAQPPTKQDWGQLFASGKDTFWVYEQYIVNERRFKEVLVREFEKVKEVGGESLEIQKIVKSPVRLISMLSGPSQRLVKYCKLLDVRLSSAKFLEPICLPLARI